MYQLLQANSWYFWRNQEITVNSAHTHKMAASTDQNKESDSDKNGCVSPASAYSTASEGENQELQNAPGTSTPSEIDKNAPITSLTAGKMMEIFTASLTTDQAQNAIQTSVKTLIEPVKQELEETGKNLASLTSRVEQLENQSRPNPTPSPHAVKVSAVDYTRRNNLVFTGIEGTPEQCKNKLNKIFKKLGVKVGSFNTFRRGPDAKNIIAEFAGHWDKIVIYKNRTKLYGKGVKDVYVNEDLNESQDRVFYVARTAKKQNLIHSAWTTEGITHISKIVKGTVMSRPVHSEDEIKALIPKLKIEPKSDKTPKTNKTQLKKSNEWSSEDHEVAKKPSKSSHQAVSSSDSESSSVETESEEGEISESEEEDNAPRPKSKFKAQPIDKPETRSKKNAKNKAPTTDEQDPKAKRLPRKAKK